MKTNIQKFLSSGGSLEELAAKYSISCKRHTKYPNLVLLKYNQIESPMSEKIVQECRGIILDENDNWNIVSRAFDKFFNYGEGLAANIDWNTAKVQEKLDGSLCVLYYFNNEWQVATSGSPDASGNIGTFDLRFSDLFWNTFKLYNSSLILSDLAREYCFYFELTSPVNRVVIPHQQATLTLLGARSITYQIEQSANIAHTILGVPSMPVAKEFPLNNIEDILTTFNTISPLSQEGYVVVDGNFNRIKIKHPGYIALHHAKDGMSHKAFVEIARSGEVPEVISAFPEFQPLLEEAKNRVDSLVIELETNYNQIKDIETQKEFALQAVKTRCSAPLFLLRGGKVSSIRQAIANMQIDTLLRLLGYKEDILLV